MMWPVQLQFGNLLLQVSNHLLPLCNLLLQLHIELLLFCSLRSMLAQALRKRRPAAVLAEQPLQQLQPDIRRSTWGGLQAQHTHGKSTEARHRRLQLV